MFKRIFTLLVCLFLIFVSIPIFNCSQFLNCSVYADDTLDGWRNATTNEEFAEAFRYYCKSRDLTIAGTIPNVLTNGSTNIFHALCNTTGINIDALQGHIKYEVDSYGNKGLKWLFDSQGITFYNRLFAQFLQDNDLEVGDTASEQDNTIFSGKYFVDYDGNGCLVYIATNTALNSFSQLGSPYKFTTDQIVSLVGNSNYTFSFNLYQNDTFNQTLYHVTTSGSLGTASRYTASEVKSANSTSSGFVVYKNISGKYNNADFENFLAFKDGQFCIVNYNTSYYLCLFANGTGSNYPNNPSYSYRVLNLKTLNNNQSDVQPATIYLTTYNKTINNNNYEGDTYITNEGDVITNEEPGGKDPGWNVGGGQGSYDDGNGNNYTINFPDFELPDLNIDWSINGLGNKFPFSIPFDIASLVTVLNAEPEAPRFQGTVNFGFTTWDYDINLQQFDSVAQVCRVAELLLLVFGLILITRSIIKG